MNSIVADKRGGAFADDLYVVLADNRNGTIRDSNNDVFFYKSTDGGATWIGPTRVNNDRSEAPTAANANAASNSRQGARDCGRNNGTIAGTQSGCLEHNFGGDQFFPWITIDTKGNLNVDVPRPAERHRLAGRRGRMADLEDRGRELPRLVLGRKLQDPRRDRHPGHERSRFPRARASASLPRPWSTRPWRPVQPGTRARSRVRPGLGDAAVQELPDLGRRVELRLHVPGWAVRGRLQRQHQRPARHGASKTGTARAATASGRALDRRP